MDQNALRENSNIEENIVLHPNPGSVSLFDLEKLSKANFVDEEISGLDVETSKNLNNLTAEQKQQLFSLWSVLLDADSKYGTTVGALFPNGEPLPPMNITLSEFSLTGTEESCISRSGSRLSNSSRNISKSPSSSSSLSKGIFSRKQKTPSPGPCNLEISNKSGSNLASPIPIISFTSESNNEDSLSSLALSVENLKIEQDSCYEDKLNLFHSTFCTKFDDTKACNPPSPSSSPPVSNPTSGSINYSIKTSYSEELWRGLLTGYADPDATLLRFLRARKWNGAQAATMLLETVRWRASNGVLDLAIKGESFISDHLLHTGKTFFHAHDKYGRLVIYVIVKLHQKNAQTLEEGQRFTIYQMEAARRLMRPGTETVTVVFDMTDFTMASMDFPGVKFLVNCFQSYYPESLGHCLIVNAPWLFWGCWKIIKPWLDPIVTSKVIFVKKEELLNYIDRDVLLKEYQGNNSYQYSFIPENIDELNNNQSKCEEIESLKDEFVKLKTEFTNSTRQIIKLLKAMEINLKSSSSALNSGSSVNLTSHLDQFWLSSEVEDLLQTRQNLINSLQAVANILDTKLLPKNYYHRLGIIDEKDGSVDWSKAIVL